MTLLGTDVDQLDNLSRLFQTESQKIAASMQAINSQVHSVWWHGQDADRFRCDWDGRFRSQLSNIVTQLEDEARNATRQAAEQRNASSH